MALLAKNLGSFRRRSIGRRRPNEKEENAGEKENQIGHLIGGGGADIYNLFLLPSFGSCRGSPALGTGNHLTLPTNFRARDLVENLFRISIGEAYIIRSTTYDSAGVFCSQGIIK